ncbi:ATP-dependent DNA helicase PIF1 [Linum perenne]
MDAPAFSQDKLHPNPSPSNDARPEIPRRQNVILDLGLPTLECKYCGAYFWHYEALHRPGRKRNPAYSLCCRDGMVEVPLLEQTPPLLDHLLSPDGDELSRHYQKHIRSYNAAFSWTSFGAKLNPHLLHSRGPYSLVLCGENYHYMGSILPVEGARPRYSQLYVFDPASEVEDRLSNVSSTTRTLNAQLMSDLQDMLDEHNVLTQSFRRVRDALRQPNSESLRLRISGTRVPNDRRYELPSGTDLAGLIPGDFEPDHEERDIIVNNRSTGLTRITSLNPLFDSLHFPLLFPYGNDGFHELIRYNPLYAKPTKKREYVTQNEYYNFRLQYRKNEGKTLIRSGKALQHFCIDAFTTIEQNRLLYIRLNQKQLRADLYNGLQDAFSRGDLDSSNLGHIIVPATFTGGVRYMQQLYQDAISICQFHGNPDLFITFTCNAQWPELVNAFKETIGTRTEDKPMLVARVFKMRLSLLRDDFQKKQYFGRTVAGMHTVEFQKRGLPHAHIILWLISANKPTTPAKVDEIISAEIPDPTIDPVGYDAVTKFMLHGPCGMAHQTSPCMKAGQCSKFYPKSYALETTFDDNGYVTYRRRQTGITAIKSGVILDNLSVVPYHRDLLVKYQAHMNVEICHKGQLIKYLFKYILKGPDRSAVFAEQIPRDEIANYLDCRSISSYEAVWRLFQYKIHERTPSVFRLSVHLPGHHTVTWREGQAVNGILNRPNIGKTMLTEWFTLNRTCRSAHQYTYSEVTHAFTWDTQSLQWLPRKKGFAIGRVRSIPPRAGDVFYLRMLLTKIRGPTSYEHLRTVNGVVYSNNQTACQALGLLSGDDEWNSVMAEVTQWAMPPLMRSTFVALLIFYDPLEEPPTELLRNEVLQNLQTLLQNYSSSLSHFGLPMPTCWTPQPETDDLISQELQYDTTNEGMLYDTYKSSLNTCQIIVHDAILAALSSIEGKLFFLYGHGGTGKTYLYNCLLSHVRSQGKIALVVASSGIAATLLPGGVTAHSRFKIPLDIDNTSTCSIKKGTALARLIRRATLIVWDEAPMVHRLSFEAVDRTICDIMDTPFEGPSYKPFGGKTVLLGGDFRQTLPIVPNAGRETNLNASLTRSYLWNHCTLLELKTNMRVNASNVNLMPVSSGLNFPEWVLAVGDGKIPPVLDQNNSVVDLIEIPKQFLLAPSPTPIADIVARVYPNFTENYQSVAYIRTRAIVTPTNQVVSNINEYVLTQIPGDAKTYLSSDTMSTTGRNQQHLELEYPTEFLNSLTFNGMPEHQLQVKPYSIVMLLRNLNPSAGLCNGTRILLTHLGEHTLRGLIIGGSHEGTIAIIPRIVLDKTDPNWPFTLKRRQYPLRLCYAMTINKSQGQTLEHIGIYLPDPVFSHGQLYVALSRARSAEGIHIMLQSDGNVSETTTRNIVYQEVFDDLRINANGS